MDIKRAYIETITEELCALGLDAFAHVKDESPGDFSISINHNYGAHYWVHFYDDTITIDRIDKNFFCQRVNVSNPELDIVKWIFDIININ